MTDSAAVANIDPGIFRAYDIRGITTTNLTDQICYWIGRAFAVSYTHLTLPTSDLV